MQKIYGKNVVSILDGMIGSCGKGKVTGLINTVYNDKILAAVSNNGPNAGHTFIDKDRKVLTQILPVSIINPNASLFLGPDTVIDLDILEKEYDRVKDLIGNRIIYAHPRIPLITEETKRIEREFVKSGSTFKGVGGSRALKLLRAADYFQGYENIKVLSEKDWRKELNKYVGSTEGYVLLESSQGCGLDIDYSSNYPHTTSKRISSAEYLSASGISPIYYNGSVIVVRILPIRINNVTKNNQFMYTGGNGNSIPLTWSEVNIQMSNGGMTIPYSVVGEESFLYIQHAKSVLKENISCIQDMYKWLSIDKKIQLFDGESPDNIDENIDLMLALEIERLYHKQQDEKKYISKVIERVSTNGRVFNSPEYEITDYSEQTSVTKKERRVFTPDNSLLSEYTDINKPANIFINFTQHISPTIEGEKGEFNQSMSVANIDYYNILALTQLIENETKANVVGFGTGPKNDEFVSIKGKQLLRDIEVSRM